MYNSLFHGTSFVLDESYSKKKLCFHGLWPSIDLFMALLKSLLVIVKANEFGKQKDFFPSAFLSKKDFP